MFSFDSGQQRRFFFILTTIAVVFNGFLNRRTVKMSVLIGLFSMVPEKEST